MTDASLTSEPEKLLDLIGRVEWDMNNRSKGNGAFLTQEVDVATLLVALRTRLSSPVSGTDMVMVPAGMVCWNGGAAPYVWAQVGYVQNARGETTNPPDSPDAPAWTWEGLGDPGNAIVAYTPPATPIPVIAEADTGILALAKALLTSIQIDAIAKSVCINGVWGLSDAHEDDPDIAKRFPLALADGAGVLTPLGCAVRSALVAGREARS